MLRIGQYDAFDKWEILRRYWEDKASVPDLGLNKLERPRVETWHEIAFRSGRLACADYIHAKADGMTRFTGDRTAWAAASDTLDASVNGEISRHLQQIGYAELQARVRGLAETIAGNGLKAGADAGFSPALVERMRDVFRAGALRGLQWTNEVGEIPTIEVLREQASTAFPTNAIKNKKRVLSLFSASFYGRSDVIHVYDARPDEVTLVDSDGSSLEDMKLIYPKHWTFAQADYAAFLREAAERNLSYDLIISDPYRGYASTVAFDSLALLMRLCVDTFITDYFGGMFQELAVMPGDLQGLSRAVAARTGVDVEITQTLHRASDVHWVVMRKSDRLAIVPEQSRAAASERESSDRRLRRAASQTG